MRYLRPKSVKGTWFLCPGQSTVYIHVMTLNPNLSMHINYGSKAELRNDQVNSVYELKNIQMLTQYCYFLFIFLPSQVLEHIIKRQVLLCLFGCGYLFQLDVELN